MRKAIIKSAVKVLKDPIRICIICGEEYEAVSYLQKACSDKCRLVKNKGLRDKFYFQNPDVRKKYTKNANIKDPDRYKKQRWNKRLELFKILGGGCIVCSHSNPLHLCIDYAPTMQGTGLRHPEHFAWIRDHKEDFRLLCANHHQELSTTGKIEGTNIVQTRALTSKKYI